MTTPGVPDPSQQPGGSQPPAGFQPPPEGNQPPPPPAGAFPPPVGAFPPPVGPGYGAPPVGGFPPPVVPAKKSKKKLIIGIVVAAVVALGIGGYAVSKTSTALAPVGACIKITSPTLKPPETSQEDCSSQAAIWVVTETGGSDITCDPKENSYVEGTTAKVCARDNLKVGECVDIGAGDVTPKKVDCSAAPSKTTIKLVALLTDSSDTSKCPDGTVVPIPLVKRNMLYCYAAAS